MHWINRAREPVMRDDREALGLRLGQGRVGGNQRDRGVLARAALEADAERVARERRRGGAAAPPPPPNSPLCWTGAAQKCGPSPTMVLPTALTATIAPIVAPSGASARPERAPPC